MEEPILTLAVDLMSDFVQFVASMLGCSLEEALEFVIRNEAALNAEKEK